MSYLCTRKTERTNAGAVVQLVRILACHARGRGFESRPHRKEESFETLLFLFTSGPLPQPVRASRWGLLPSQGTDGHSVHLLKDLVRPCMGGSNYGRLVATSAVHYTPRPWEGQGGGSEAEIEIVEGERIFYTARQVGYYFNMDRNKPVRFPKEFLDYYESI